MAFHCTTLNIGQSDFDVSTVACEPKAEVVLKRASGVSLCAFRPIAWRKRFHVRDRRMKAMQHQGQMIAFARKFRRRTPRGGRRSLRAVAGELARNGYVSQAGNPFTAIAVARMLGQL
ncbi:hypothetical protein RPC_4306 [Rhodopseudomonas palustris BisB18]|uniref:Uncharacterized protein n=1 Tax=Rhodopseudomonas palustris (strain BisB18) TaxID=316056 RepID=Q20YF7_RHOPB